jgi:hypothetical protein
VNVQSKDIFPPKRTLLSSQVQDRREVIFLPNEVHPLHIFLLVEFVQLLEKKGIILNSQIDNP